MVKFNGDADGMWKIFPTSKALGSVILRHPRAAARVSGQASKYVLLHKRGSQMPSWGFKLWQW